ncbi:hypothetical protein AcV5_001640 [Taiwanofungus camphoratus]|nr:hypothetical protein AcV5_001640 [Antrodia cinnamomea]KAI0922323.1 hypothetical protein AcV7_005883 [Antrodia cinnamomea]
MRSSHFALLCVTAAAVLANAGPSPTRTIVIDPRADSGGPHLNPINIALNPLALAHAVPMTNAQRMARGLPLNRPRFKNAARNIAPRASNTPNPCSTRTGTIGVSGGGIDPASVVSRTPNEFGEYGITSDAGDALQVQYTDCGTGVPVDLVSLNGIADFTLVGGIVGYASTFSDIGPGSYNYVYIGGTAQTPPNSPPMNRDNSFSFSTGVDEQVESAIWHIDRASDTVSAQWINADSSQPTTYLAYSAQDNYLFLTGDVTTFEGEFGSTTVVTLTFIQISS